MSKFKVEIKETLCKTVEVEASGRKQAEEIVFEQWQKGKHVLDSDHFKTITFEATQQQKNKDHER